MQEEAFAWPHFQVEHQGPLNWKGSMMAGIDLVIDDPVVKNEFGLATITITSSSKGANRADLDPEEPLSRLVSIVVGTWEGGGGRLGKLRPPDATLPDALYARG
jgi:hypothetical protein